MSKLALLSNIERAMNGLWDKAVSLFATKGEVAKKADKVHNHDDRYYTESEMNTKLSGKADTSHNHDDKYFKFAYLGNVTDFNTAKNEGKYVVSKDSDIPNAPYKGALYGTLIVFHRNGGEAVQNFISSDGRNVWVRHWNNSSSAFGTWVKLSVDGHDHNNLYYTRTEMNGKLDTKANLTHNHDDLYYTESEMNTKLAGKSDTNHNHDTAYYKRVEVDSKLDEKAAASHNHDDKYLNVLKGAVADFNTALTKGVYYVSSSANVPNAPETGSMYGILEVMPLGTGGYVIQRLSTSGGRMFTRYYDIQTKTFSSWVKIFCSNNKPTWSDVQGKPETFTPATHNHDNLYYTESEMNTKLAAKADATHNHDTAYYKRAEVDSKLANKSDLSHNHDTRYLRTSIETLSNGADFNTRYTANGTYNVSATSTVNGPFTGAIYGTLFVYVRSAGDVVQVFIDATNSKEYIRRRSTTSGVWSEWYKRFSTANKPTWNDIDGKPSSFTPATHTHDDRYYTESEMNTKLAAKADTTHNHDTAYYKRAEVDSKLGGKADTSHTHNYLPSGVTITKEGDDFYINY